jgi:exoribonuclease R
MTTTRVKLAPEALELARGFARIRRQMRLPTTWPPEVQKEAETAAIAARDPAGYSDARDVELVTIDPPGSRDLDQAFHAKSHRSGYVLHYAIADVGAFVAPGSAIDVESRKRGQTLYCPDERVLLYPVLSEGAASLLPDRDRPSVLWTIELDHDGRPTDVDVRRALVRSRAQLTYEDAQRAIDNGDETSLGALKAVGELRLEQERARGGVSLNLPDQEVVRSSGSYHLAYRVPLPVESWNAQISLLTGMAAAEIMIGGGVGLLRTMPAADDQTIALLRRSAGALGHEWPQPVSYPDFVRTLDPARPGDAALVMLATRLFRGVGYTYFDGVAPADAAQHAIAAPYAHVTAPLRRLADRFATEIVLSLCANATPPAWCLEALPQMPDVMKEADRRAGELERRVIDFVEAVVMESHREETFDAVVVELGRRGGTIQIKDPAVLAPCDGSLQLGSEIRARLVEVDPERGRLRFAAS